MTLPGSPPQGTEVSGIGERLGINALGLLKERSFAVFFCSAILIGVPMAFYYQNANLFLVESGVANPTGKMTIGQISEAVFILLLPLFFRRFGFRITLLVGMFAPSLPYTLFAVGNSGDSLWMLLVGIALVGLTRHVFPQAQNLRSHRRHRMRQGLNARRVHGAHLLDDVKKTVQLTEQLLAFFGCELKTGQMGKAADLWEGQCHGIAVSKPDVKHLRWCRRRELFTGDALLSRLCREAHPSDCFC